MEGRIAVTDGSWYERLSRSAGPKDANFWRPSTRAVRLPAGSPFLFKLRAPANAIAGVGFFAGFSVLPDWLAWDTFGEANGVADLGELRAGLRRIRAGARIESDEPSLIGCCLIAEAQFFERADWVAAPSDWHRTTQSGENYDLTRGEGERVWRECVDRLGARPRERVPTVGEPAPRYGAPVLVRPRLGQAIFRVRVFDAYQRACAVTEEHSLPVLEAAHIRPYGQGGEHAVANGVALRTDVHRLLDRGYVTVDRDLKLVVGRRLKDEFSNGRSYYALHGRRLTLPREPGMQPSSDALEWHRTHVFRG